MLITPFCPYSECANHTALPITGRWYYIAGSYESKVNGTVTRFTCLYSDEKIEYQEVLKRRTMFSHFTISPCPNDK